MTVLELVCGTGTPLSCGFAPNGGYERRPDTFHLTFDPETEPASHAVVKAAAFVHNVEPTELPPLGTVLDPDALDVLISDSTLGAATCKEVTFTYESLDVRVTGDGDIWLSWA